MAGNPNTFAELFKKYRLKAEIPTLSKFGHLLAEKGFNYEDSIFSHWQSGSREPQSRFIILKLIEIFSERKAITSINQANEFLSSVNQGYLTEIELTKLQFEHSFQVPFQVPNQIANFTGRENLITKLKSQSKRNKILLLCGPPGVGKTSIAIKLGFLLRKEFPDGVLWFRLDISDAMDVLLAIAHAFGKDISNIQDKEIRGSVVRSLLISKRVLFIFDNAEPDVDLSSVLPNTKDCLVIVTSRNSFLKIPNEYKSVNVPEFNREEVLFLFKEINGKKYLKTHRRAILKLADGVGNLPLALHILAQEIKRGSISIVELIHRLDQDPIYIEGLFYENKNLAVALEVSFNLLSEVSKKTFISLAIFNGKDFSIEAVSSINELSQLETKKHLENLRGISLIENSTSGRYRIHPLIKKFIRQKLNDPELFLKASEYYQNLLAKYDKKFLQSQPYMKQEGDNVLYIFRKCYEFAYWNEVIALWDPLEQLLYSTKQLNKMRDVYRIVKTEKSGLNIFQKSLFIYVAILITYWSFINYANVESIFWYHLSSLFLTGIPLFGGVVGLYIAKSWGLFKSLVGKSLFLFSLGLLSWGLGNLVWAYYNFFLDVHIPYPSWADLGYLPSYIFWTIGIIYLPHVVGKKLYIQKKYGKLLFLIPIFVLALSHYLVVFITKNSLVFSPVTSITKLFFDIAYPVADAIILTAALLVGTSFKFLGGKYKLAMYSFVAGFCFLYIADFLFSYTTTAGIFHDGGIIDIFFIVGYSFLTFGILGFYFKPEKNKQLY